VEGNDNVTMHKFGPLVWSNEDKYIDNYAAMQFEAHFDATCDLPSDFGTKPSGCGLMHTAPKIIAEMFFLSFFHHDLRGLRTVKKVTLPPTSAQENANAVVPAK
jgi:hypothetical protein